MPALDAGSWAKSIQLGRYDGNSSMAVHHHEDSWISVVVDGSYEERIRGRNTRHGPGNLLFYPAFERHAPQFSSVSTLKILIEPSASAVEYLGTRLRLSQAPYIQSAAVAELGLRFASELRRPDDFSEVIVQGFVLETVGLFHREASRPTPRELPWLRAIKAFIEDNDHGPVSIEELARMAGRHPIHLSRAFRQIFGQTVGECLRSARVRHAAQLLLSSRQPLSEIAAECGFCDQAHLSRSFKKLFGVTPGAFRIAGASRTIAQSDC
jgi:AraC family transcriptional regulator